MWLAQTAGTPVQSLVASGSRDTLIKLWDARAGGEALQTLHAHRAPLSSLQWHHNGRWLLSSGRDHIVKVGLVKAAHTILLDKQVITPACITAMAQAQASCNCLLDRCAYSAVHLLIDCH